MVVAFLMMSAPFAHVLATSPAVGLYRAPRLPHSFRGCPIVAALETEAPLRNQAESSGEPKLWREMPGGIKFVDEVIGNGALPGSDAVVSLHYTVSFAVSGMELGTSRGHWPLSFSPSKHPLPIFAEGIAGMRVGGRRRLSVPAHLIPESQVQNVPQDQAGEGLRFEVELIGVETGTKAFALSLLPPGSRRRDIARTLFLLSFLPYFLSDDVKPEGYRFGDVEDIQARHEAAANSVWLGGAAEDLGSLFP